MKRFYFFIFCVLIIQLAHSQDEYLGNTILRNNSYSFKYFSFFNKNDNKNLILFPFGASTSMAMAYIGSEGKTEQLVAHNMNFITPFGVLLAYKQLIKHYQTYKSNEVNLLLDNALFINNKLEIQKKYKNLLKVNFAAHVESLPFKSNLDENSKLINQWAKKSSNYNILNIIRSNNIDTLDKLIYINYVYLNGNWDNPFDEQFTGKDDFYETDTVKRKVDFMNQTSYLKYNENNIFQIIELPYSGRNLSMIILLPKENGNLDSISKNLNSINFDFWVSELYTKLVSVSIPKFRIEFIQDISPVISSNECELPFTNKAEFSRISDNPVHISKIIQGTIINVEENKNNNFAEQILSSEKSETNKDNSIIKFKADKPFLFVVKENIHQSILLIGKVVSPGFDNFSADYYHH